MQTELRDSLVQQADRAFMTMVQQVSILLDGASTWSISHIGEEGLMDKVKRRELRSAVVELGSIPKMLAGEITRWKRDEPRVLSSMNTELNLLNELYSNMEALLWFFTREEIKLPGFSLDVVRAAHSELFRCNRLL